MEGTKEYTVKTGRVLHGKRYYEPGESIQLNDVDAQNLGNLGIIHRDDPFARMSVEMDGETVKTLYVQGWLDLGPKHPANGVAVLMEKDAAEKLGSLGIVSFAPEENAAAEELPVLEASEIVFDSGVPKD